MKTELTALTLLLGLLTMAADALAQSAPAHAPIITRPVAADFAAETFTLFWRPPTLNANAVTEYRIYREQNAAADRDPTAHPTHCDTVDFSVRLTAHTFTVTLATPPNLPIHRLTRAEPPDSASRTETATDGKSPPQTKTAPDQPPQLNPSSRADSS